MKRDDAIKWLLSQDSKTDWDITKHKEKRTLSQNAYYWVLIGKMSKALNIPMSEQHNRLLRDYGQILRVSGVLATVYLPDDETTEKTILRAETYHLKPTATITTDRHGRRVRGYVMLRGSSELSTDEMTTLLNGTIEEARQMGIETLTPEELERMRINENKHHNQ